MELHLHAPPQPHHTPNTPLKEVLAPVEVKDGWTGVLHKLTEGTPAHRAPTFLEELARDKTLARK